MTGYASADSLSIMTVQGNFVLARARLITWDDAHHAAMIAVRMANASEIAVVRLTWELDGSAVDSPIGEFGSRVTATVELLLVRTAESCNNEDRS